MPSRLTALNVVPAEQLKQHHYTQQKHQFFDNLVTLVAGIAGLIQNRWPELTLFEIPLKEERGKHPITLSGLHGVHGGLASNAFVQYYEAQQPQVKQIYSDSCQEWPAVWNFGWVVRNALVHKGKIYFESSKSLDVS